MADPVSIPLAKDTWVKVADNVTTGRLLLKQWQPDKYLKDYRMNGNPAPTNDDTAVFVKAKEIDIGATAAIDVYLKCVDLAGEVIAAL